MLLIATPALANLVPEGSFESGLYLVRGSGDLDDITVPPVAN